MGNVKVFFAVNIKRLLFKKKTILKESIGKATISSDNKYRDRLCNNRSSLLTS